VCAAKLGIAFAAAAHARKDALPAAGEATFYVAGCAHAEICATPQFLLPKQSSIAVKRAIGY
jgi:hypothetical protein